MPNLDPKILELLQKLQDSDIEKRRQEGLANPPVPQRNLTDDEFLDITKMIESSGGKDLQHRTIQSGLQAGTSAKGAFGLMPNTADEIINRRKREGTLDEEDKQFMNLSSPLRQEYLEKNPQYTDKLAKDLINRIRSKSPDDEASNYMYQFGHNVIPKEQDIENIDRTEKFRKLKNDILKKD